MCVAAAIAGAGVVGGVASSAIGASASKSAANTQADAARDAAALQQQQYDQTRSDLQPYRDLGTQYIPQLNQALANPALTSNFSYGAYSAPAAFTAPTQREVEETPGYQFTLAQGLKAAQNSASARGLGSSGAALKGAETFANGLADSTYNDSFNRALNAYTTNANTGMQAYTLNRNNALGNFTTNYGVASDNVNRLLGVVGNGQNAAAQTGALGTQSTNSIASTLTAGANAQAAGTVGAANAMTGGISSAVNGGTNALLLNSLINKQGSTLYGNAYSGFDNPSNYG